MLILTAPVQQQQPSLWIIVFVVCLFQKIKSVALWSFLVNSQKLFSHSVFTRMHCVYPWSQTNLTEVFPFDYFKSCYIYLLLVFLFCTLLCLFAYFHYRLLISRARRQSVYEQNWEQQAKTLLHSTMSGQKHYRVTLELILVTFLWRLNQNSVGSNNVCELVVQCGWLYPVCVSSASTVGSCQIFWGKKKFWVVQ